MEDCLRSWSGRCGAAFGFEEDVDGVGAAVPEVEADAGIGELCDGGGDGTGGEIPAGRENHGVAGAAQATVEDQFIAIEPITDGSGLGLRDAQADGLTFLYG